MTNTVTFSTTVGGDGSTVTDDSNATTGLANGGFRVRLLPMFTQIIAIANFVLGKANAAATSATNAATSETNAGVSASAAASSASSASASAGNASDFRDTAKDWATKATARSTGRGIPLPITHRRLHPARRLLRPRRVSPLPLATLERFWQRMGLLRRGQSFRVSILFSCHMELSNVNTTPICIHP